MTRGVIPPFDHPATLDEKGYLWIPSPDDPEETIGCYVHDGLRIGWLPVPELGGLIVTQLGGLAAQEGFEDEGVASLFSVEGMRRYARDLLAIADSAEASR